MGVCLALLSFRGLTHSVCPAQGLGVNDTVRQDIPQSFPGASSQ